MSPGQIQAIGAVVLLISLIALVALCAEVGAVGPGRCYSFLLLNTHFNGLHSKYLAWFIICCQRLQNLVS